MSGSVNKVFLMGNLTRDPELRPTASNQPVASLGIAVNRRSKTRDGDQREETTFVDCEAWGRTAEVCEQYLAKGSPVFIEGRLKLSTWEQDGHNRSKLSVVIENVQFLGDSGSKGQKQAAGRRRRRPPATDAPRHGDVPEESIPF